MSSRINTTEYIEKYSAEFGVEHSLASGLPCSHNALSEVSDPENWQCYPGGVVRLWLHTYQETEATIWVLGVGDLQRPTICTLTFETLDLACCFICDRPSQISFQWLEEKSFYFLEYKL